LGHPGNFNGFRILAALLHGTLVVGVSQTAALNRGRHLYSAGRPWCWALAHISSCIWFCCCLCDGVDFCPAVFYIVCAASHIKGRVVVNLASAPDVSQITNLCV